MLLLLLVLASSLAGGDLPFQQKHTWSPAYRLTSRAMDTEGVGTPPPFHALSICLASILTVLSVGGGRAVASCWPSSTDTPLLPIAPLGGIACHGTTGASK